MTTYQRICLAHYHEIGLKGHNRSAFEMRLLKNLESILTPFAVVTLRRIAGRICVYLREGTTCNEAYQVADVMKDIPGVARVSCGFKCPRSLEIMSQVAAQALSEGGSFLTFKVAARRNHTDFTTTSMQLNQIVGEYLCHAFPDKQVKMKHPDLSVGVEVVQDAAYIYAYSKSGIGGLPVGSSGKVISLLSSGIDSPVATWRLARRGAICIGVHFSGHPQTSDASTYLVDDIAHVLAKTECIARIYTVSFGDYQREIALAVPPALRVIMYRRLMFKVAQELAYREGALALVTGESLGQVASQTLENIRCTDAAVDLPVLRPLIGSDKRDIIDEAKHLGTFDISIRDTPDCCTLFMPRSPETHGRLSVVERVEQKLPFDQWIHQISDDATALDYPCSAYQSRT